MTLLKSSISAENKNAFSMIWFEISLCNCANEKWTAKCSAKLIWICIYNYMYIVAVHTSNFAVDHSQSLSALCCSMIHHFWCSNYRLQTWKLRITCHSKLGARDILGLDQSSIVSTYAIHHWEGNWPLLDLTGWRGVNVAFVEYIMR